MSSLLTYIQEKLNVNKSVKSKYNNYTATPTTNKELTDLIIERITEENGGTIKNPVNLNDIDISNINDLSSFFYSVNRYCKNYNDCEIVAIDITTWDVRFVHSFSSMFEGCTQLRRIGNLSAWNTASVESFGHMFSGCKKLESIGDISDWNVGSSNSFASMFNECKKLKDIGDLSEWDVSKSKNFENMFKNCERLKNVNYESWEVDTSLTRSKHFRNFISGTTNWKLPSWYRQL